MKRLTAIFFVLLPLWATAQEYDFAKKIGGNVLYFYITSTGGKNGATVEVTFPGTEEAPWKGYRKPSGQLTIPDVVTPDRAKGRNADPEDDDTTIYTVTAVRYNAFMGCDHITRLTLPATIKKMGESAFADCSRIAYIVVEAQDPPKLYDSSFDKVDLDIPVRVPAGSYELYRQAIGWRQFTEIIEY